MHAYLASDCGCACSDNWSTHTALRFTKIITEAFSGAQCCDIHRSNPVLLFVCHDDLLLKFQLCLVFLSFFRCRHFHIFFRIYRCGKALFFSLPWYNVQTLVG